MFRVAFFCWRGLYPVTTWCQGLFRYTTFGAEFVPGDHFLVPTSMRYLKTNWFKKNIFDNFQYNFRDYQPSTFNILKVYRCDKFSLTDLNKTVKFEEAKISANFGFLFSYSGCFDCWTERVVEMREQPYTTLSICKRNVPGYEIWYVTDSKYNIQPI